MPHYATTVTATGNTTLLATEAGVAFRIHGIFVSSKYELDAEIQDSDGTLLCPIYSTSERGGAVLPWAKDGWVDVTQGKGIRISQNATGTTGVLLSFTRHP